MAETPTDFKRKATERRQRILDNASMRMSRIQGHPAEETTPLDNTPIHAPSVETPHHIEQPVRRTDDAVRCEVASVKGREKKTPSTGPLFETAAIVMHVTQRLQILIAALVAVWYTVLGLVSTSPLGLLFVSEVTLISGTWMYLTLVPSHKRRQMELLRHERRFLRNLGGSWIPNGLYRFDMTTAVLRIVNDVHLCFRIVYADVAVFVVLCIALRQMDTLSVAEL